jgi:hypothetical protein
MHCSTFGAPNRCIPALQELKTGYEKSTIFSNALYKINDSKWLSENDSKPLSGNIT